MSLDALMWRPHSWARWSLLTAFLLADIAIGLAHYAADPSLDFTAFFVLPTVAAAWILGSGAALGVVVGAVIVSAFVRLALGVAHSVTWVAVSNLGMRAFVLALLALSVATLRRALEQLHRLAGEDPLTGLVNRRHFWERSAAEIVRARRYRHPFSVAFIDLDGFKLVNDTLGHQAGDAILRRVAQALNATLRHTDTASRLGGDEFAVLMPETDATAAAAIAPKLRAEINRAMELNGWQVTCSMGVVAFQRAPASVEEVIRSADALMYEAKRAGKDTFRLETFPPM